MRVLLRWGVRVLRVGIALLILLWLAFQLPFVQQAIGRSIFAHIEKRTAITLRAGTMRGDWLQGMHLQDVRFAYDETVTAAVRNVYITWNLWALRRGQLHLTQLRMEGARVYLASWPRRVPAATPLTKLSRVNRWSLRVDDLWLQHIEVIRRDTQITLSNLRAALRATDPWLEVQWVDLQGDVVVPGAKGPLVIMQVRGHTQLRWREPSLTFRALSLRANYGSVRVDGSLALCPRQPMDLRLAVETSGMIGVAPPVTALVITRGVPTNLHATFALATTAGSLHGEARVKIPIRESCVPQIAAAAITAEASLTKLVPTAFFATDWAQGLRLDGRLKFRWNRPARVATAALEARGVRWRGRVVPRLAVRLQFTEHWLRGRVQLAGAGLLRAKIALHRADRRFALRTRAQAFDLGPWLGPGWSGAVSFDARARGGGWPLRSMTGWAQLRVGRSRIGSLRIASVRVPLVAEPTRLQIHGAFVDATGVALRMRAEIPRTRAAHGSLALLLRANLPLVAPALSSNLTDVAGLAFLHVNARGDHGRWRGQAYFAAAGLRALRVSAVRTVAQLKATDISLQDKEVNAELSVRMQGVRWASMVVTEAVMAMGWKGGWHHGYGRFFASLQTTYGLSRVLGEAKRVADTFVVSLAELEIALPGQIWRNQGRASVSVGPHKLRVQNVTLVSGDAWIDSSFVWMHADPSRVRIEGSLSINRLRLGPWSEALGLPQLDGQLDAQAFVSGEAGQPHIDATVAWAEPSVRGIPFGLATVRLVYDGQSANVQVRLLQKPQGGLVAGDFEVNHRWGYGRWEQAPIRGRLRSEHLDIGFVQAIVPQVQMAGGQIHFGIAMMGQVGRPVFSGTLGASARQVRIKPTNVSYDRVAMYAAFEGRRIVIRRFVAASGKGWLSFTGSAELAGWRLYGLVGRLQARRFPLAATDRVDASVHADILLSSRGETPQLTGRVVVVRALIRPLSGGGKEVEPLRLEMPGVTIVGLPPERFAAKRALAVPWFARVRMAIMVDVLRNAWSRNEQMSVEWQGSVTVWKDAGVNAVHLAGELRPVRGYVLLQGRKLTVESGAIRFLSEDTLVPTLDLTLVYETLDYRITLAVNGTTEEPAIRISSEPPLSESEAFAVLLVGQPSLGSTEDVRGRIGGLLGGLAAEPLRRLVGAAIGLDILSVGAMDEAGGVGVGVGKYIRQNVFVQYQQYLGVEAGSELRLEYYFSRHWLLTSSASTVGEAGVDVFWQTSF